MGEEIERSFLINESKKLASPTARNNNNNVSNDNEEERSLSNPSLKAARPFNFQIKIKILIIQNIGILLGFGFMLLMAFLSEHIKLED
jgi:hypothetical protein